MTALCDQDLDLHDSVEVHWSTSTILAIFFAASLISAVFFGLGYSFGGFGAARHSVALTSAKTGSNTPQAASLPLLSQTASSAGGAAGAAANPIASAHSAAVAPPVHVAESHRASETRAVQSAAKPVDRPAKAASSVAHAQASLSRETGTRTMVQVGAIGDRRDAERLVLQLRKKGFHAAIYPGKHDKFLHVQIGPFTSPEQAQSMRHRVIDSGYHAILKSAS